MLIIVVEITSRTPADQTPLKYQETLIKVSMRRYSEFVALQAQIQRLFPDLPMPSLPGKWFLKMSEVQLQKRRAGLEQWIQGK